MPTVRRSGDQTSNLQCFAACEKSWSIVLVNAEAILTHFARKRRSEIHPPGRLAKAWVQIDSAGLTCPVSHLGLQAGPKRALKNQANNNCARSRIPVSYN